MEKNFESFKRKFGTNEQCVEYIEKIRRANGYKCPKCGYNEFWKTAENKYKCKKCGCKVSLTSNTIFQNTHIPLTTWFYAIWLFTSLKGNITISKLQEELNIGTYQTAWRIMKKIKDTANLYCKPNIQKAENPIPQKLRGTVEITDNDIVFKYKKDHIIVVAVEIQNNKIGYTRAKVLPEFNEEQVSEFLKENIEKGSTIKNGLKHRLKEIPPEFKWQEKCGYNYYFPYANREVENIQRYLNSHNIDNLEKGIKKYCIDNNKRYCSKLSKKRKKYELKKRIGDLTFEDILQAAIKPPDNITK